MLALLMHRAVAVVSRRSSFLRVGGLGKKTDCVPAVAKPCALLASAGGQAEPVGAFPAAQHLRSSPKALQRHRMGQWSKVTQQSPHWAAPCQPQLIQPTSAHRLGGVESRQRPPVRRRGCGWQTCTENKWGLHGCPGLGDRGRGLPISMGECGCPPVTLRHLWLRIKQGTVRGGDGR